MINFISSQSVQADMFVLILVSESDHSYVYRSWKVEDWAKHNQLYSYNHENGHVTVKKKGIYFIYAQVCTSLGIGLCARLANYVIICWVNDVNAGCIC
jgi:TNF(Tumour Necrosis Factor) family